MGQGLRTALLELDCASPGDIDQSIRVMQPALRPLQLGLKLVGPARITTTLAQTQCVIECNGVTVRPSDIVVGDDDGVLVADAATFNFDGAAAIERSEAVMRERMLGGHGLIEMLNYRAHTDAVSDGRDSKLAFVLPPADEDQ